MKTIAAAAVLMMLSAPAWADDAARIEADDPANSNEPIVLSEVEMDDVTAGVGVADGYWVMITPLRKYESSTTTIGGSFGFKYDPNGN